MLTKKKHQALRKKNKTLPIVTRPNAQWFHVAIPPNNGIDSYFGFESGG